MASSASMSSPSGPRGSRSPSVTSDDNNGSRFTTPDPDMVKQYQELMATILPLGAGAAPPPAAQAPVKISLNDEGEDNDGSIVENGVKRPMTKAEKQNAKKKRRKEREREAKMDEVVARREEQEKEEMAKPVAFRLFSARPVLGVSLLPAAEEYDIPRNPRLVALEPNTAARIRAVAAEAAFNISGLQADHQMWSAPGRRREKPMRTLHGAQTPSPVVFIAQAHSAPADKTGGKRAKPKPGAGIPRIDLFDEASMAPGRKRQRTKRTRRGV